MINVRAQYLKAVLFNNNLLDVGDSALQSQCYTVQDYHYHCYHERDAHGEPFGGVLSDYLEFSIIISELSVYRYYFQCLDMHENTPFSFIFNATFNEKGRLTHFEDGMITYGYIVDVEELCAQHDEEGNEQMLLHVKMLLSNITYLGSESKLSLEITKD